MSDKKGIPILPSSWQSVRLGDFVENDKGKKPKNQSKEKTDEYCMPYIDIKAFEKGIYASYTDGVGCRLCSEEDFLMVWDGSRSGLVGKGVKGAVGSTLVRINFPRIVNNYAYYFLQSKYLEINTRAKGVGIPHVDPNLLWGYEFPIPPFKEQHRIVSKVEELFSEIDKGVESLKTAKAQLQVYRQALLKHAFEGKLTEQWRKDNPDKVTPATELLEQIKLAREQRYQQRLSDWGQEVKLWEAEGKEDKKPSKPSSIEPFNAIESNEMDKLAKLPCGWAWIKFENLIEYVTSGSRGWAEYYSDSGAIFIRAQNLKYDRLELDDIAYVMLPKGVEGKRTLTKKDDLLITITGANVTKTARVKKELDEAYVSQHVALCRLINGELGNYLYMFLIAGTGGRKQLEKLAYGAGKPGLNLNNIKNMVVPVTSTEESVVIAQLLDCNDSELDQINRDLIEQMAKSSILKQSILKKAFSAQLVEQDPNDEPASKLLERIQAEKLALAAAAKLAKASTKKRATKSA